MLGKIKTAKAAADESLEKMMRLLVNQGKSAEAKRMMVNETLPLLNKYRDAWASFTEYEEDQLSQAGVRTRRVMPSSGGFPRRWCCWRLDWPSASRCSSLAD